MGQSRRTASRHPWLLALIALGLLARAASTPGQEVAAAQNLPFTARQFLTYLIEGDYEKAATLVNPAQRGRMSAVQLERSWTTFQANNGAFLTLGESREADLQGVPVVTTRAQFEQRPVDIRLAFAPNGRVMGVQFAATIEPMEVAGPPPYADPEALEEIDYAVDSGEFKLPGTLTLPRAAASPPVVLLISSAGPNDRDATTAACKPLRDLAWGLATRGIATVRFDKRTRIFASQIDAVNLTYEDEIVEDALNALRQLREDPRVDGEAIFLLGHGLGGHLTPAIAAKARSRFRRTPWLAGAIIMAGQARPLAPVIEDQLRHIAMADGLISQQEGRAILDFRSGIATLLREKDPRHPPVMGITYRYLKALNGYDCLKTAARLKQPLLVAQGGRDFEVSAAFDFELWKAALADRPGATFKSYPNLNHLFVAGDETSYPAEYQTPGHVDGQWIADLAQWIETIAHDR